ncbi:hypothetical protein [Streptomyces sp. NPDC001948]
MSQFVLIVACLVAVAIVTAGLVIYGITKIVVGRTNPAQLPDVLRELGPILLGVCRALANGRAVQTMARAVDSQRGPAAPQDAGADGGTTP